MIRFENITETSICVTITAPLYFWKEFDAYQKYTLIDSDSIADKIYARKFTLEDFSHDYLSNQEPIPSRVYSPKAMLEASIENLNLLRQLYLDTKDQKFYQEILQLLPYSYHEKRTIALTRETLTEICKKWKDHKLDEYCDFCHWVDSLNQLS